MKSYEDFKYQIQEGLSTLGRRHSVAFAAACAERLIPNYFVSAKMEDNRYMRASFRRTPWQDEGRFLQEKLDETWSHLEKGTIPDGHSISQAIERIEKGLPDEDNDFPGCLEVSIAVMRTLGTWRRERAFDEWAAAEEELEMVWSHLGKVVLGNQGALGVDGLDKLKAEIDRHPVMKEVKETMLRTLTTLKKSRRLTKKIVVVVRDDAKRVAAERPLLVRH